MTYDEKIAWSIEMAMKNMFKSDPDSIVIAENLIHDACLFLRWHKDVGLRHFANERELAQEFHKKKQQENEV